MELLQNVVLGVGFALSQKFADHVSDNSDCTQFSTLTGVIEGFWGFLVLLYSSSYREYFLALLIYWLINNKIDTKTHLIGLTFISYGFVYSSTFQEMHYIEVFIYLLIMLVFKMIKPILKKIKLLDLLYKLQINFIATSIIGSIIFSDIWIFVITLSSIITVQLYSRIISRLNIS